MANILSQDEVDALLGAVERGEVFSEEEEEEEEYSSDMVTEYNFRRPNLVTKDQLRGFTNLHSDFAREFQSMLSIFLRTNVNINLVSAEQQQYSEFVMSLSDITHMVLFSMRPLMGMGVLEINLSLVFGVVDLLLGGEGDVESAIRKLTEVEIELNELVVKMMFESLVKGFEVIMPVEIQRARCESSPEYVQAAPDDAPVVVLTFDAKIGLANGIFNFCYPLPMVQRLLREMHGKSGQMDNYYGKINPIDSRRHILSSLMEVPMRVGVGLGNACIKTKDWLNLTAGDILVLDSKTDHLLPIAIEGEHLFEGYPGKINKKLGVKICKHFEVTGELQMSKLIE